MTKPVRGFRLTMVLEADTREDFASLFALRAEVTALKSKKRKVKNETR